ncbi:MAG TPA: alkaline phosphatase family protein, partial [Pirellulales bacterium]|nr:alkaline phosphatase family protein [Pirellulales bacterium]
MERRDLLAGAGIPTPDHVVIVVEENHSYSDIVGSPSAPYINSLANGPSGALFTQSFAVEHPSQPNYLDLFSGSNQGITDDNLPANLPFTTANLGAELLAKGQTFVGYSEDLPSVGFNGETSGAYARKHNPWVNWQNSSSNGIPAADNQPFTSFPSDFNALPTVSIVIPNLNDDMHDGSISAGDTWLRSNLDAYVQWATTHNSLLIVTFDEDDGSQANQIPTLFVGPMVNHAQYSETINHFDVLRTIEDMYGLPYAGASSTVPAITDVWQGNSGTFVQQGSVLNVAGTSGNDQIVLAFDPNDGTQFSVSVNNASNRYNTSTITEVNLQGGAGSDEVVITDPVNAFAASLSPNSSTISRTGFAVNVSDASTIYVYGNSKSSAQLFDAPTGSFVSSPTYSYVSGSGFFDMAANFGSLYGYAGGNSDVASLYSAAGDSFVATGTYAYTADPIQQEFFNAAVGFHSLYAYGSASGTDTAYLYSAAADWFV